MSAAGNTLALNPARHSSAFHPVYPLHIHTYPLCHCVLSIVQFCLGMCIICSRNLQTHFTCPFACMICSNMCLVFFWGVGLLLDIVRMVAMFLHQGVASTYKCPWCPWCNCPATHWILVCCLLFCCSLSIASCALQSQFWFHECAFLSSVQIFKIE